MKILQEGNPILNFKVTRFDDFQRNLDTANTMLRWIVSHKRLLRTTVGLASNQLGLNGRVILVRDSIHKGFKILINPSFEVVGTSESRVVESCLSVKGDYEVSRWDKIRVIHEVLNFEDAEDQNPVKEDHFFEASFLSHVIQHEIDHLNGKLISGR